MIAWAQRYRRLLLQASLSVLIIVLLVRAIDVEATMDQLAGVSLGYAILAAVIWPLGAVLIAGARWITLLRALKLREPNWADSLRLTAVGVLYSVTTFGQAAGDAMRAGRAAHSQKGARAAIAGSVVVDRLIGLAGLVIVLLVGSLGDNDAPSGVRGLAYASAAGLLVGALVFAVVAPRRRSGLTNQDGTSTVAQRARRLMHNLAHAMGRFTHQPRALVLATLLAVVTQITMTAYILLLAEGLGLDLPPITAAWLYCTVMLVQALPISIAGFGAREAIFVTLGTGLGLSASSSLALSVLVVGTTVPTVLVIGAMEVVSVARPRGLGDTPQR